MYREVIAHVVRGRRPRVEVRTAEPEDVDAETVRFSPDLVVCHRATAAVRTSACSWVELEVRLGAGSLDANIKVDHRPLSNVEQAEIVDILAAIDETDREIRRGRPGLGPVVEAPFQGHADPDGGARYRAAGHLEGTPE